MVVHSKKAKQAFYTIKNRFRGLKIILLFSGKLFLYLKIKYINKFKHK
jgi:hypothetical protein